MENMILNALPSIRERISPVQYIGQLRNRIVDESDSEDDDIHDYESADEEFSFDISTVDRYTITSDVDVVDAADKIFHHGHILPLYPASTRKPLSMDDKDRDTDTDASPVQAEAANETFDEPKTAPGSPIKSWSTGSTRRRNTIRELLFGARSHSDGKEKLGFCEKGSSSSKSEKKKKKKKKKDKGKSMYKESKDSNNPDCTKNNNGEKGMIVKARRRSFLPYFGFFGGPSMHGFNNI